MCWLSSTLCLPSASRRATRRILNLYLLRLRLQKLPLFLLPLTLSLTFSVCAGQRYISIYCRQQQHGHSPRGRRGRGQLQVAQQRQPTSRPPPRSAAARRSATRPRQPATGLGISAMAPSWLRNLRTSKVACVCVRASAPVSVSESWPPKSDKSAPDHPEQSQEKQKKNILCPTLGQLFQCSIYSGVY